MSRLNFKLEAEAKGSKARAATFTTLHGEVKTPIFMPVGTRATVPSQTAESLKTVGSNVLLANTYHLLLRPGPEVMKQFGGIHQFMKWDRPVLTDSGGFQIFSLPHSRQMNEDGALFQSYVDKKMILLSPELSIQTQRAINSDIMMVLDQCIPSTSPHEQAKAAMELTHRWAKRSLIAREDSPQSMFAIVQGACFADLRKQSADALTQIHVNGAGFDGYAVGGLAVGETKAEREDFTELTTSFLPRELPRYLMGVGTPLDILEAVHRGIDMFDCIIPSQLAERGTAFTSKGKFQLRRSVYKFDEEKLDPNCDCNTCTNYSRAYLHHLHKAEEVLGWHLITLHNLTFYHRLMAEIRSHILADTFLAYYQSKRIELAMDDEENPPIHPKKAKPSKSEKNQRLGDYEIHVSKLGHSSIKQISSGEIMHPVNAPIDEARALYLEPANLPKHLAEKKRLVIWDVGLGAATNAMAVIEKIESVTRTTGHACDTHIVSFEIDLDPMKLALKNSSNFTYLRHAAPHAVMNERTWKSEAERIEWSLHEGDFLDEFKGKELPDLIFYDPFSLHTDSKLWTLATFQSLIRYWSTKPMKFMTFSAANGIRAMLLSEGLYVGYGVGTGPKATTTVAFNDEKLAHEHGNLLGAEWLATWGRSQTQFPAHFSADEKTEFERKVRNHPQFK